MTIPLSWSLVLAAILFCAGLYAVLARRNAVGILMGVLLMLNGVVLNLIAFWRNVEGGTMAGQAFGLFIALAAVAEAAVGIALAVVLYRSYSTAVLDDLDTLEE
jgi:NADH:ubiquinone oxidoreductase subunit K